MKEALQRSIKTSNKEVKEHQMIRSMQTSSQHKIKKHSWILSLLSRYCPLHLLSRKLVPNINIQIFLEILAKAARTNNTTTCKL